MKLVTFVNSSEREATGVRVETENGEGRIIDLRGAIPSLRAAESRGSDLSCLDDMISLIERKDEALPLVRAVEDAHARGEVPDSADYAEKDVQLLAPVPRPVSMRDGYAFRQHVETARKNRGAPMIPEFDQFPVFYFTNHLAVTGPGEVVVHGRQADRLDYELEVAVVTGKSGRNFSAAGADDAIFGYMIMNDWSARALQMEEMKLNLGPAKGKDFATSTGPYLVPRESLAPKARKSPNGEKHDLSMRAWVNDRLLSEGNLKDMNWTFAQIIERVSYGVEIHPGEVIGSGTVGTGCLLELNGSKVTDDLWLGDGDEVVLEVEALGRLVNRIKVTE